MRPSLDSGGKTGPAGEGGQAMGFAVIPAVDIRGGRCVRLYQGREDEETVFSEDPVAAALMWQKQGAPLLHVVDLDGAFSGKPSNVEVVTEVAGSLRIPVEVGGGIRDTASAEAYLDAGVSRVIVGTSAFERPGWLKALAGRLGERLVVGLDVKEGSVALSGWTKEGAPDPLEALERLVEDGVRRIIYTDTSRDGTLHGPNFEAIERVAAASPIPVIAAGGVGELGDIARIAAMRDLGVEGVIVGMALYRKKFTLAQAILAAERGGA